MNWQGPVALSVASEPSCLELVSTYKTLAHYFSPADRCKLGFEFVLSKEPAKLAVNPRKEGRKWEKKGMDGWRQGMVEK